MGQHGGMPNRTVDDEREKLDHSGHPATHAVPSDLRAPGGAPGGRAELPDAKPSNPKKRDTEQPRSP
jgi:hypothetical protein